MSANVPVDCQFTNINEMLSSTQKIFPFSRTFYGCVIILIACDCKQSVCDIVCFCHFFFHISNWNLEFDLKWIKIVLHSLCQPWQWPKILVQGYFCNSIFLWKDREKIDKPQTNDKLSIKLFIYSGALC